MMRIYNLSSIVVMLFLFVGCSSANREKKEIPSPDLNSLKLEWTAYKTTDKIPVKGWFKNVEIKKTGTGPTVECVLEGTEFVIETFSIWTGDEGRDEKIKTGFFARMLSPEIISGEFYREGIEWYAILKMNGVTVNKLPVTVKSEDNRLSISAHISLADFKVISALEAFNQLCYDLHKGADGISKTWAEVDVSATLFFK